MTNNYNSKPYIPNKNGQNFLQNDNKKTGSNLGVMNLGGASNLLSKSSIVKQGPVK